MEETQRIKDELEANLNESKTSTESKEQWESWGRQLAQDMIQRSIKEQRWSSRFKRLFRLILLIYLGVILFLMVTCEGVSSPQKEEGRKYLPHVAVLELHGEIAEGGAINAEWMIPALREAFKNKNSKAVLLKINSPGGSPVQSGYIYDEIVRLKQQHPKKKIYSVISEQCASAAYHIASATDEIYANRASLVGSIGVRLGSFSYVEGLKKIGVERNVTVSGKDKLFMDPYTQQTLANKKHAQHLVDELHQQFVDAVKRGRGNRLDESSNWASGLVWAGPESVEMGLVDGLGDLYYVTESLIEVPETVNYSPPRSIWDEFFDQLSYRGAAMLKGVRLNM
jgi:protease-4